MMPLTPEQKEWAERHRMQPQIGRPYRTSPSDPKRCANCQHFYRHGFSPGRYQYCRLRKQKGTTYGHAKTQPTMTCDQFAPKP